MIVSSLGFLSPNPNSFKIQHNVEQTAKRGEHRLVALLQAISSQSSRPWRSPPVIILPCYTLIYFLHLDFICSLSRSCLPWPHIKDLVVLPWFSLVLLIKISPPLPLCELAFILRYSHTWISVACSSVIFNWVVQKHCPNVKWISVFQFCLKHVLCAPWIKQIFAAVYLVSA